MPILLELVSLEGSGGGKPTNRYCPSAFKVYRKAVSTHPLHYWIMKGFHITLSHITMSAATSYAYLAYLSPYEDLGLKVVPYEQDCPKSLHKALARTFTTWLITDSAPSTITLACNGKSNAFGDIPYDGYSLHSLLAKVAGLPSLVNVLLGRLSPVLDRFCASIELAAQTPATRHEASWIEAYGTSLEAMTHEIDAYCTKEIAQAQGTSIVSEVARYGSICC